MEAFVMCGASHVLPQSNVHSERANKGTEGHAWLTKAINGDTNQELTPRGGAMVERFPLGKVLDGVGMRRAEVAYAFNPVKGTCRELGIDLNRNYGPLNEFEIATTLDVEGFRDGIPVVRDWKFGITASWWQARIQAMAVAARYKASVVDGGFVFIDGDKQGAEYVVSSQLMGAEQLDEWAASIVKAWERAKDLERLLASGGTLPTAEGEWCKYCGAFPHCPAKWKLARAMLDEVEDAAAAVSALSLEQCGKAWQKLAEIKRLAGKLEDDLKERMMVQPFPLSNGKRLEMVKTSGWTYPDKMKTLALVRRLGASQEQIDDIMKKRADSYQAREVKR